MSTHSKRVPSKNRVSVPTRVLALSLSSVFPHEKIHQGKVHHYKRAPVAYGIVLRDVNQARKSVFRDLLV